MVTDDEYIFCINCGQTTGYGFKNRYINFYENIFHIYNKSIYHRKYHIENILNGIDGIQINYRHKEAIYSIFDLLDRVQPELNANRMQMINIKFIFRKLFQMMGFPYNEITITKSKKALQFYNQWWKQAYG